MAIIHLLHPAPPQDAIPDRVAVDVASAALVLTARQGGQRGRSALNQLLDLWQSDVYRWCRLLGGSGVVVEDAVHDTLLAVVVSLGGLSDAQRFRGWLWGLTWRTVRGHRRRAWLRRWVPGTWDDAPDPRGDSSQRYEAAERSAAVQAVLDALPVAQRELLWLAYAEGLSRAEIAAMLSLAPGTLNRRLTKARLAFEREAETRGLRDDANPSLLPSSDCAEGDP